MFNKNVRRQQTKYSTESRSTLIFKFPLDSISCSPRSLSWLCKTILRTLKLVSVTFCPLGSNVLCDTFSLTLDFSFFINFLFPDLTMASLLSKTYATKKHDQVAHGHEWISYNNKYQFFDWERRMITSDNEARTRQYSANGKTIAKRMLRVPVLPTPYDRRRRFIDRRQCRS